MFCFVWLPVEPTGRRDQPISHGLITLYVQGPYEKKAEADKARYEKEKANYQKA